MCGSGSWGRARAGGKALRRDQRRRGGDGFAEGEVFSGGEAAERESWGIEAGCGAGEGMDGASAAGMDGPAGARGGMPVRAGACDAVAALGLSRLWGCCCVDVDDVVVVVREVML